MEIRTPSAIPGSINIGGKLLSPSGLIIYQAEFEGSSTQGSSFYRTDSTGSKGAAASVVTAAKTFILHAVKIDIQSATSNSVINMYLAYGDTFVTNTSPPANIVGMISGVTGAVRADAVFGSQVIGSSIKELAVFGSAPAGKFPFIYGQATGGVIYVTLYGYEV